ncbi:hypothetical protein AAFC00_006232 [Neodothiora populina]|uniref:Signal peptidase complex subunit 2 n=1 Tax=Neodothiora populina TaxID=2781224 RepID=A0ABR3P5W6_9PEZI
MSGDSRISPYNLADCKNTTDDALQNYLASLPSVRQSHFHTDVKLALGYSAVIIAAVTFAYDYKLGFDATKHWTAITVAAYFILNGVFTYWIWAVEKGTVFTGDWKGRKLSIISRTEKLDPTYRLKITYSKAASSVSQTEQIEINAPFTQWFTADGFFVAKPFQQWLASSVPLIGEADPKNAIEQGPGATSTQTVAPDATAEAFETVKQQGAKMQSKVSKRK